MCKLNQEDVSNMDHYIVSETEIKELEKVSFIKSITLDWAKESVDANEFVGDKGQQQELNRYVIVLEDGKEIVAYTKK